MQSKSAAMGSESRASNVGAVRGDKKKMRRVKFQCKADMACSVFLAGSFNNWNPKSIGMERNGEGQYIAAVLLPPGRHEYKFVVNGQWQADPACQERVCNALGSINSVIEIA